MHDFYRTKMLLIDDAFLMEVHGLERKVNQAIKHPEPVLKLDAPWDRNPGDSFNYINVIYDREEALFKMWYVVAGRNPGQYWEEGRKTAYATSKDGIHWERPIMNMVEVDGSRENNYILPRMLSLNYNIIFDPDDEPARRYKITFTVESPETRFANFHSALCIAFSEDGIHWDMPVHVNPVMRGVSDDLWGFLYDPDRRVYQLYTRRVPNLPRDISLYESKDLVNWVDRGRVLVAPDKWDPPEMFNLHGMAPFFYEDFSLGLLGTMTFVPKCETFTVFREPPADWPVKNLGKVEVELAFSRDGVQWLRPRDRTPLIPIGEPGAQDGGCIFPTRNDPIVIDGETWIYYNGSRYRHTFWAQEEYFAESGGDARNAQACMLARMPEDHWVSLDAGHDGGWFLTRPSHAPARLMVNADAAGGRVEAELRTPYGETIEGFTLEDCMGVSGDGKDQEIRWKGGDPSRLNAAHLGGLCLKFHLVDAKLYSYSFLDPDPDGATRRYWQNARWNEAIMHRSDDWSRDSNEPARGLPQPPGTQNTSGTRFGPNPRRDAAWDPDLR
ncbi:MAG: hypothetical protein CMJ18_10685 [Phycisphaeraceae bacterium]|nr:hypothetical protein [Phycisphaeraceae bacterium]